MPINDSDKITVKYLADAAVETAKIKNSAVTNEKLAGSISDDKLSESYLKVNGTRVMLADLNMNTLYKVINLANGTNPTDAVNLSQIQSLEAGLDIQLDVLGIQVDNTLVPETNLGSRYIITNSLNLHVNFGTISGLEDNDIVQYNGTAFYVAYDVSVKGKMALVANRADDQWYNWSGTSWNTFTAWENVIAGAGLTKDGKTINVGGSYSITVNADNIEIRLKTNGGLAVDSNGVYVDPTKVSKKETKQVTITLTATDITNKYVDISDEIIDLDQTGFFPHDGIKQSYGKCYTVIQDGSLLYKRINWSGLGLEGVLAEGDKFDFVYKIALS